MFLCWLLALLATGWTTHDALFAEPAAVVNPSPFIDVIPNEDGTELLIQARGIDPTADEVMVDFTATENTPIGPTGHKGCYGMSYSEELNAHVATVIGFTPESTQEGSMSVLVNEQASAATPYTRSFVETVDSGLDVRSEDGNLQLTFISEETAETDIYIAVTSNGSLPALPPEGHRVIGLSYSVRASGATLTTTKPMNLRLLYGEAQLGEVSENSLGIFRWDGSGWVREGGRVFADQNYVTIPTSRFGTYALMAMPEWADDFDDATGLDFSQTSGVQFGSDGGGIEVLQLESGRTDGVAVSRVITPPLTADRWGMVDYEIETAEGVNGLTIDVLDSEYNLLLPDVASGDDLTIDWNSYPALRLRAVFTTTDPAVSPRLDSWRVSWVEERFMIYLPYIAGTGE